MAPKKKTKTELGAKVTDAGEDGGEFFCAGHATGALAAAWARWRAARALVRCARTRNFSGCFPRLTRCHLLWVAAGEPDSRAEKEQADAAAAEESPTVITSAGPEAPKLDLPGMLSPGAAARAPQASVAWRPLAMQPFHCAIGDQPWPWVTAGGGCYPRHRLDFQRSVAAAPLEPCWERGNGVGKRGSDPVQHDLCLTGWRVIRATQSHARMLRVMCACGRDREMVRVNVRSGDF